MMTEPESKEPSPEALAFIEVLFYPHYPRRLEVGRALDAAIAAGAEGALRRQAEVRQPGEYESFDDSITREAVTRLAKELATEKASHEATRKELEAERCAHARTGTALVTMTRASDHMRIQWQELAALRKPLDGELAKDVETVGHYLSQGSHTSVGRTLAVAALSRIEAALQVKGPFECADCSIINEILDRQPPEPPAETPEPPTGGQAWNDLPASIREGLDRRSFVSGYSHAGVVHAMVKHEAETPEPRAIVVGLNPEGES